MKTSNNLDILVSEHLRNLTVCARRHEHSDYD